jgi:tetratricopeptide (TPR) repeat protein
MKIKQHILELLSDTYAKELEFAAGLDETERAEIGTLERWSAKDNLAHCATWQKTLAENLEAAPTGSALNRTEDINLTNEKIFNEHQADSLEEIMGDLKTAYEALAAQTSRLSEKELDSEDILPWQRGRPLWRIIVGNGALHPISHLAACYAQLGRGDKGLAAFEAIMPRLAQLSTEPAWQGMLVYDLACFCALAGDKSRAIEALKEALQLAPEFAEWSKQDSDLESLREETEFRALYKD